MKSSRNQLIAKIAILNKHLKEQQIKFSQHKNYLAAIIENENLTTFAMLVPAFITGWKMARLPPQKHRIKKLLKLASLASITIIKSLRKIVLF